MMLVHYFKVAIRNLVKYRVQSVVSLFCLAAGFVFVSLSLFWNRYETTYDASQPNAERIYRVRWTDSTVRKVTSYTALPLASYLMETFPEVEKACYLRKDWVQVTANMLSYDEMVCMSITPETLEMFDFGYLEGDWDIASWGDAKVAISEEMAVRMFGAESPVGKVITLDKKEERVIVAVFKTCSAHSNFHFDLMRFLDVKSSRWSNSSFLMELSSGFVANNVDGIWSPEREGETYVMLREGTDYARFVERMSTYEIREKYHRSLVFDVWTPLTALHYTYPEKSLNVRITDVRLFAGAACLLAVCALLNYLTLFISRLRNRGRDLALRTLLGSSGIQTSCLLLTEYLLLLLGALLVSVVAVELCINSFMTLALIEIERFIVYEACLYLLLFVLLLAVLLSFFPIYYFKRKTLHVQIVMIPVRLDRNFSRLFSVLIQLVISMLFMFCSVVMLKQFFFLMNTDLKIERKQIGYVTVNNIERTVDILKQIPSIKEVLPVTLPLFPTTRDMGYVTIQNWDEKPLQAATIRTRQKSLSHEMAKFYGLRMKQGPEEFYLGSEEVFVNEAFVKAINVEEAVGKMVHTSIGHKYKIKGVIYDYHDQSPNQPVIPMMFVKFTRPSRVAFKYSGEFTDCKEVLEGRLRGLLIGKIQDGETTYAYFMRSEYNLLKLLGIISLVSLLIALLGIYALIVQSCEQHRKEIAIRRVNGAQVSDILLMFFKQYMFQVVLAAVVAFPIGYLMMKNWLQDYTLQTSISFWIFIVILLTISILVTLCVFWHVWRAASENPAGVIRKE